MSHSATKSAKDENFEKFWGTCYEVRERILPNRKTLGSRASTLRATCKQRCDVSLSSLPCITHHIHHHLALITFHLTTLTVCHYPTFSFKTSFCQGYVSHCLGLEARLLESRFQPRRSVGSTSATGACLGRRRRR